VESVNTLKLDWITRLYRFWNNQDIV